MEKNDNQHGFIAVLSNVRFLLLWLAQVTSQTADRVFVYILMIVAYNLTQSNLGVSIPLIAFGVPSVLFASLAGVYVDKLDRKGILLVTNIVRGLLILLIIPAASKSLLLIFLISFLIYTATQFFAPAETSTIPELIDKKYLIVANSLFMVTWMASSVVGFGLGAPLVNFFGNKNTFIISAALYFISAMAIFLIPLKFKEPLQKNKEKPVMDELKMGFEFIRRNDVVRYSLLKLFVAASAIAILSVLAIGYAKDVLHIGEKNFGYLILVVGFGMILGMGVLEKLTHYLKKGPIVILSFIFSGLALIGMSLVKDLVSALLLIVVLGVGNIFITSSIQTILQHRIPRQIRGRVFGVQNMVINSAFTFPVVIFGYLADLVSIQFSLALLGAGVLLMGLAGIFLPKFKEA
ncbi:MFS transporter [Candidatus Margulisiibacteriota bacterium]